MPTYTCIAVTSIRGLLVSVSSLETKTATYISNTSKTVHCPPDCLLACLLTLLAYPPNPGACFPPPMDEGLTTAGVRACVHVWCFRPMEPRCCTCIKVRMGKTQPARPRGRRREDSIINRKGPTARSCHALSTEFNHIVSVVKLQISLSRFHLLP
ncbi:hypothetical protein LZ32DRAFT_148240 [Colletotrichum eremochloae]|nr:hypothetical protein LZ32DRAFT_148240 [Colletotrichum eremochloae]